MFSGDVAWKKLSGKCPDAVNNIEKVDAKIYGEKKTLTDSWDPSKDSNTYKSYYNPFGSSDEWSLHNGYNDYQLDNIKNDMYNFFYFYPETLSHIGSGIPNSKPLLLYQRKITNKLNKKNKKTVSKRK